MCERSRRARECFYFARIKKSKEHLKFHSQLLAESTRLHFPGPNLRRSWSHPLRFWVFSGRFVACSKIASELHDFIDSRSAACLIFIRRQSN